MSDTLKIITAGDFNPEEFAGKVADDEEIISELMDLIYEKKEQIRFNSYETLRAISELKPEMLYERWDQLEGLLYHRNNYLRFIAINLLANLAGIDSEGYFERAFDKFFGILKENVTIAPAYVIRNSWKIVLANPHLEPKITNLLLDLDQIHHGKQIALLKGEAIEAFDKYFTQSGHQHEILEFVGDQRNNPSPKARKLARDFLERRG